MSSPTASSLLEPSPTAPNPAINSGRPRHPLPSTSPLLTLVSSPTPNPLKSPNDTQSLTNWTHPLSPISLSLTNQCIDAQSKRQVIIKRIKDDKRFTDQSLTEIYVLSQLSKRGDANSQNFLALVDYFYLNVTSSAATLHRHRETRTQLVRGCRQTRQTTARKTAPTNHQRNVAMSCVNEVTWTGPL